MLSCIGYEGAVVITRDAAIFSPGPQSAVAVFVERGETVAADAWAVAPVEDREAYAVEARQAVQSGQPEVTIAGLEDRLDGVLWQSVVRRPGIEAVLSESDAGKQKAGEQPPKTDGADTDPDADWNTCLVHQPRPHDNNC